MSINHIAFSTRKPSKKRCGDASFSAEMEVSGENIVLLIVADGVSKAPKDWLASESVVDFVTEEIQKSKKSLPDALAEAIEVANRRIWLGVEDTFGMLTTLSLVLYHPEKEKLYWCNIGDSRIFGLKLTDWIQLSTDDSTSTPYKENGKLKLQNGAPVMLSVLTRAIGSDDELKVNIQEVPSNEYIAIALASDGFYELSGFNSYATSLASSADMEKEAQQIQSRINSEIQDDASFAVLRLPGNLNFDLRKYLTENKGSTNIPTGVLDVLEKEIRQSIIAKDDEYLKMLLDFMSTTDLYYSKPKMIEILELMIAHKSQLVQNMTLLIRKI